MMATLHLVLFLIVHDSFDFSDALTEHLRKAVMSNDT